MEKHLHLGDNSNKTCLLSGGSEQSSKLTPPQLGKYGLKWILVGINETDHLVMNEAD